MNSTITTFEEYNEAYANSISNPEGFWDKIANEYKWTKNWDKTLEWEFISPQIKWFIGGKTNITTNCIDRHLQNNANEIALIWEPNEPSEPSKSFTFQQLHDEVCKMANVLKNRGIKKGDRVCIYMPMIPELSFAVLACARIGAIHSVVFGGFSSNAIADRIIDATCKAVITSDGMFRGNKSICVKEVVDEALQKCDSVSTVLVISRTIETVNMVEGRDFFYNDEIKSVTSICEPEIMDSEDPLFILYTSGSTGKPKGVVHTVGGYMVYTGYTFRNVFQYKKGQVFFCTADIGWITGHSYLVYGPLLNGATTVMFEGIPTYPHAGRFWEIIDKHSVNIFYTAPTAIRSLMQLGLSHVVPFKLSSLKMLGSVGEPINEEAWHWYDEHIGKKNCPITDTWWQTETGGIMIGSMGGFMPNRPAHAGYPMPGIQPELMDASGNVILENGVEGLLCIKFPWPSIIRTTYGDHERCRVNYFSAFKGKYFTGDGAKRDENGLYRIIGRVDDVINVSGHRFGTAEIENAINEHPLVIESAVVGFPHDIKGQAIYAFVICESIPSDIVTLRTEINEVVCDQIGKIAKPDKIQIVSGLPKTRSGKIMRRILRKIAEGDISNLGDISTLLDPSVIEQIKEGAL